MHKHLEIKDLDNILKTEDPDFYLYQYPEHLAWWYGEELIDCLFDEFMDGEYMGVRTSQNLIDYKTLKGKTICEYGCNVGSASFDIVTNGEPLALFSLDISHKCIEICEFVAKTYGLQETWFPVKANILNWKRKTQISIWQDPHTASNDEWTNALLTIISNTTETIYFLECDNIYHIFKKLGLIERLVKIGEYSWRYDVSQ